MTEPTQPEREIEDGPVGNDAEQVEMVEEPGGQFAWTFQVGPEVA